MYSSPEGRKVTKTLTSEILQSKTESKQNYLGKFYIRCKILTVVQETLRTELRQTTPHLESPHGSLRQTHSTDGGLAILLHGDSDGEGDVRILLY